MSRLTEDDVRRIVREEMASGAPVIHTRIPAAVDAVKVATAQYLKAYTALDGDPARRAIAAYRNAANDFDEATREYGRTSARDGELRQLAARKVRVMASRLRKARNALNVSGYFAQVAEATGDE